MDFDDTDSLVSWTLSVFGELPFDLLEETWVNAAWENRYTDLSLPDVDLLEAVEGNSHALLEALSTACEVCQKWSCVSDPDANVGEEDSSDDKLWRALMDNGVHYKALLGLVYVGIGQGNLSGAALVKKKIALRFSKLYFNLVLVPGSSGVQNFSGEPVPKRHPVFSSSEQEHQSERRWIQKRVAERECARRRSW
ncbi:hypothetical protein MRX96_011514 [Rhipicephalus microplus]